MLRFQTLKRHGAGKACISGLPEGDCGWRDDAARGVWLRSLDIDPGGLVSVRQEHGRTVAVVTAADRGCGAGVVALRNAPLADALVTDVPDLALGITVADCVPVFLVAPGAIGLAHAGREGTRLNIAGATVDALREALGVTPGDIHAVVGPSAGPCCYEVDAAMAEAWRAEGLPAEGRFLDLWEANRRQLATAGVPASHIVVAGRCTICGEGFHSFRRDQTTARNLAILRRA